MGRKFANVGQLLLSNIILSIEGSSIPRWHIIADVVRII